MPSMMDAWFRLSEMTASSLVRIVSNSPPFASKQLVYRIVSSVPRKAEICSSSWRWMSRVPQMKRTLDMPNP